MTRASASGSPLENRATVQSQNVSSTSGLLGKVGQTSGCCAAVKSAIICLTRKRDVLGSHPHRVCTTQHVSLSICLFRPRESRPCPIVDRLTAGKEDDGKAIEIGGKKVALGILGAKPPTTTSGAADPKVYPLILLTRPGTADEAAAAMPFVHPFFTLTRSPELTDGLWVGTVLATLHSPHT